MRLTLPLLGVLVFPLSLLSGACQSPTNPSDTVTYDDAVDVVAVPDPIVADGNTNGRTYRIVRGNNQPDEIVAYDWHAGFSSSISFNSQATDDDLDVAFPVRLTSATLVVKQASGGIITPPTGAEKEYYEFVTHSATGNSFAGVGSAVTLTFETWYDLPSLRKEAVVSLTLAFADNQGRTFQKVADINVAP